MDLKEYSLNRSRQIHYAAEEMIKSVGHLSELSPAKDVLSFMHQFGYCALPTHIGGFGGGPWLTRESGPATQRAGIAVLPYLSDEAHLIETSRAEGRSPGSYFRKCLIIALHNIDWWSELEVILTYLHEAKHALQRHGKELANIEPSETEEFIEGSAWTMTFSILNALDYPGWSNVIEQAVQHLEQHAPEPEQPGTLVYCPSATYYPDLDRLFAPTDHQFVKEWRMQLVSIAANTEYWSQRLGQHPIAICSGIMSLDRQ